MYADKQVCKNLRWNNDRKTNKWIHSLEEIRTTMWENSRNVRKCYCWHVRTVKLQISLHFRAVWSKSSLSQFWIAKDTTFLHANKKYLIYWAHVSKGTFCHFADKKLFLKMCAQLHSACSSTQSDQSCCPPKKPSIRCYLQSTERALIRLLRQRELW